MADSVTTLVSEIVDEGGFDATQAQALSWLNRRHRQMVAATRAWRKTVSFGSTVAGTGFYPVEGIVELLDFKVGGIPYSRARRGDVYGYSQGTLLWVGPVGGGLMVEDATSSGVRGFTLVPAPDTAGLALTGYAAVMPDDLVLGGAASTIKVDADFYDALVSGAISTGLLRVGQRPDLASSHEQIFQAAVDTLNTRDARRRGGGGSQQIRVIGVNA